MADSALGILQRAGEQRGADGHFPDAADFDEHVIFYKSALRFTRIFVALVALLLIGMCAFLIR